MGTYTGLSWAKQPPVAFAPSAVLIRVEVAAEQVRSEEAPSQTGSEPTGAAPVGSGEEDPTGVSAPAKSTKPRRFYGMLELDMVRPVKAFDAVLTAVVMELQRTADAKVKITIEIEAQTEAGFEEGDISVVRDNARQLKFRPESTGFE